MMRFLGGARIGTQLLEEKYCENMIEFFLGDLEYLSKKEA